MAPRAKLACLALAATVGCSSSPPTPDASPAPPPDAPLPDGVIAATALTCVPACTRGRFCDVPDEDSICGTDGRRPECHDVPTSCPPPGPIAVCGCDGHSYASECEAHAAGVALLHHAPCVPIRLEAARMSPSCAPDGGPAWEIVLTERGSGCETFATPRLEIRLWGETLPERLYGVSPDGTPHGIARLCPAPDATCVLLDGNVYVTGFSEEGALLRYSLSQRETWGTLLLGRDVAVSTICGAGPGCS